MEYIVLWFWVNDHEWVAHLCDERDLKRGTVELRLKDEGRNRWYSIGYHSISWCGKIGKFNFGHELPGRIKWEDREKVFKKYPELRELAS